MTDTATAPARLPEWLNLEAVMDTDMQAEMAAVAAEVKALEEAVAAVARRSFRVNTRCAIATNDCPDAVRELLEERTPLGDLSDALASLIGHLVTAYGEDALDNCGTRPGWLRDEVAAFGEPPYWLEKYLHDGDASEEVVAR